jgi:hypothetical protein
LEKQIENYDESTHRVPLEMHPNAYFTMTFVKWNVLKSSFQVILHEAGLSRFREFPIEN